MQLITRYLHAHPHLAEMLKGGAVSLILKCCGAVLSFLLTLVVARLLDAEAAGQYFLMLSVVTALAALVRTGWDQVVVRQVAAASADDDWRRINGLYRSVFRWVLFVALVVVFLLFVWGDFLTQFVFRKPELASVWSWMIWAVVPFSLYVLQGLFFQGVKRMPSFMFSQGVGLPLFLLFLIGLVWLSGIEFSSLLLAELYVVASLMVLLVLLFVWWRQLLVVRAEPAVLRKLAPAAMPLWGVQIVAQVLQWSAPILLGVWAASSDVAIFSVAFRTAMLTSIVLMAVNSVAAPKFAAQYHRGDMRGLHQVVVWSTRLMLIACAPVVSLLLVFPERIMGLFGDEFMAGSSVLMVLAMGQLVNVATGSVGFILSMTGHEKDLFKSTLIAALIMLSLCVWLIPLYGMLGAATAQVLSLSVQMLLNTWYVKKALGFAPMNIFAKLKEE